MFALLLAAAAVAALAGCGSSTSKTAQVGEFAVTVPRGFYQDKIRCPIRHCALGDSPVRVLVTNHPLTAANSPTVRAIYPANLVVLDLGYLGSALAHAQRPPLNLHELHPMGHELGDDGTAWSQVVSGRKSSYQVSVFEGNKASAADRAAVLRALSSIHGAR
jgi:hypothetical protein